MKAKATMETATLNTASAAAELVETIRQHQEINAAAAALTHAPASAQAVAALPEHFKLHDLERYQPTRRRMAGTYETRSLEPFAQYIGQHGNDGSCIFVDADSMRAQAILDLGTEQCPGHAEHRALLALQRTAAYAALCRVTDCARSQKDTAEFFEDWASLASLRFYAEGNADGMGEEIPARRAIAALRAVDITPTAGMEGRVEQLSSSLSAFEQVKASSKDTLPDSIHFGCKPYADLNERCFVLRLSVTAGDKGPRLTLRIKNLEAHQEEMAQELSALVQTATTTHSPERTIPVLLGTYSKG